MVIKKYRIFIIACLALLHLSLSLYWSRSFLFNYGRLIPAWDIIYKGFRQNLFSDYTPPGLYVISGLIHFFTHYGIHSAQKLIDLLSGEAIIIFFSLQLINRKKWWLAPLMGFSSLGFISPLISQGGEGIVALLVILGLYLWQTKKYLPACFLFAISLWFKFLFYFILPGLIIFTLINQSKDLKAKKKELCLGVLVIFLSLITYHGLDGFQDLSFQIGRVINNNSVFNIWGLLQKTFYSLSLYLLALILGFPFLFFSLTKIVKQNIFLFVSLSLLFFLSFVGFVYYYPFAVFAFLFAAIFTGNKWMDIKKKEIVVSLLLNVLFFIHAPFLSFSSYRPNTKQDYQQALELISSNYHGGVVVLPLNFSLEFPLRSFVFDALPSDEESLKQIEWVVIKDIIPTQLLKVSGCQVVFETKVSSRLDLYRFECED